MATIDSLCIPIDVAAHGRLLWLAAILCPWDAGWCSQRIVDIGLSAFLDNQIDITRVPFSDRGSRLLVYKHASASSLYIKLAERLIHAEPGIESYLKRPPFIDEFCFLDTNGIRLDFGFSVNPEEVIFSTKFGKIGLVFQDKNSLAFGLPENVRLGISFKVRPIHWYTDDIGGYIRNIRNAAYQVFNCEVVNQNIQYDTDGIRINVQLSTLAHGTLIIGMNDVPPGKPVSYSVSRKNAEIRWNKWFDSAPAVEGRYSEKYAYAWWVMANNLIGPAGNVHYEAMMPTKAYYVGLWLWDCALHSIALRHIDPVLAQNQIRVMLENQLPDGMLPDVVFDEGVVNEIDHPFPGRVTKPPILAWVALKVYESAPDHNFLEEIYDPLSRCNAWWFEENDDDNDGIIQYSHPYSSGLDDSPLWDYGMPVESPDINTYLYVQMKSLAQIATILGKVDEAKVWDAKAKNLLANMIEQLWDESLGLFTARFNEKSIPVKTPFNLLPLWTGELPQAINDHLIQHLKNPYEFWGRYGLPTVAFDDPTHNPDKMWRGPTWVNVNYFFIEALTKLGHNQLAEELRIKTLDLIASQPDIREYYNTTTGVAPGSAAPAFGWSAALFIDLLLMKIPVERNITENKANGS